MTKPTNPYSNWSPSSWTRSHRRDVYAGVESVVKRVLRRRGIKGEQFRFLYNRLMKQAEAIYEDWPMAA